MIEPVYWDIENYGRKEIRVIHLNSCNQVTLQKIKFVKTVFTIGNSNMACDILLLEIGEDFCCYALLNGQQRNFQQIKYFTFEESEAIKEITGILDGLKNENCEKVIVSSAFSQSMLVPHKYAQHNQSLLNAVYDLPSQKFFSDSIAEWQMIAAYSIPQSIYDLITDRFPSVQFFHAYTAGLKIYNGFVAADQIDIHFSTQHFRVLVKKDKHVQLAQTYSYKTPLDVAYYLLKICYEFKLNQSEVFIIVSGLIDQDSAMYNELHNYFLNLNFAQAPSYSLPGDEHPHHYFTSLYNLAACVS